MAVDPARLVREAARELGFLDAGLAPLAPSPHAAHVRDWLAAGKHGQMDYLARSIDDRLDPRGRFPWAKSVAVLSAAYEAPSAPPGPDSDTLDRLAAYARGRDYHKVLDRRARALGRRLAEAIPDLQWRAYVDSGPLLERELAARAGLGWIGKHGLVLSETHGSYFLLAAVLLSLELDADADEPPTWNPPTDPCGGCTACLDACPTAAFDAPRALDATRCLSYLTIEARGPLPALDPAGYVFGCDLCQLACPYNAAPPPGDPDLAPSENLAKLSLADLVALDEPTYQTAFRASAVKRASRAGLRRNAMWLARALGDEPALAATRVALQNSDDPDDPTGTVAATARAVLQTEELR